MVKHGARRIVTHQCYPDFAGMASVFGPISGNRKAVSHSDMLVRFCSDLIRTWEDKTAMVRRSALPMRPFLDESTNSGDSHGMLDSFPQIVKMVRLSTYHE
jgi:hypothetical protein